MTNEERDAMIRATHNAVLPLVRMVEEHHTTLFGNGSAGLKEYMALTMKSQVDCPARAAASIDSKRLGIATVMMVVAILGIISSIIVSILSYLK